jgi:hypothetical protein
MQKTIRRDKKLQSKVDKYLSTTDMPLSHAIAIANGDILRETAQKQNEQQIKKFANQHKNKG